MTPRMFYLPLIIITYFPLPKNYILLFFGLANEFFFLSKMAFHKSSACITCFSMPQHGSLEVSHQYYMSHVIHRCCHSSYFPVFPSILCLRTCNLQFCVMTYRICKLCLVNKRNLIILLQSQGLVASSLATLLRNCHV